MEFNFDAQWAGSSPWVTTPTYISGSVNGNWNLKIGGTNGLMLGSNNGLAAGAIISSFTTRFHFPLTGDVAIFPFSGGFRINAASNQLKFGAADTPTIVTLPADTGFTYTVPNPGVSSSIVLTRGTQEVFGTTSFASHGYDASSDSGAYGVGTVSTAGVSSYVVSGSGTTFNASMLGGVLVSGTQFAIIIHVPNTTEVRVATPVTISASSSYVIYNAGTEMARGYMSTLGILQQFTVQGP